MAHLEPMGLNALEKMYDGLKTLTTDIDNIVKRCVDAAEPAVDSAYKGALAGSVPRNVAISASTKKAERNSLGVFSVARTLGHSARSGTRYGAIAAFYHYGVPGRIPATGFRDRAVAAAEAPATELVNKKFEEEVKKLLD